MTPQIVPTLARVPAYRSLRLRLQHGWRPTAISDSDWDRCGRRWASSLRLSDVANGVRGCCIQFGRRRDPSGVGSDRRSRDPARSPLKRDGQYNAQPTKCPIEIRHLSQPFSPPKSKASSTGTPVNHFGSDPDGNSLHVDRNNNGGTIDLSFRMTGLTNAALSWATKIDSHGHDSDTLSYSLDGGATFQTIMSSISALTTFTAGRTTCQRQSMELPASNCAIHSITPRPMMERTSTISRSTG